MTGQLETISEGNGRGLSEIPSGNLPGETEERIENPQDKLCPSRDRNSYRCAHPPGACFISAVIP
jgi:hypothetical protein